MRVVVLMGGRSAEREVSLATGRGVLAALAEAGHEGVAFDPGTGKRLEGREIGGGSIGECPPERAVARASGEGIALTANREFLDAEVVFIALHGGAGEDGTLQALLDLAGMRYTGSGMLASALAMDKARAKVLLEAAGVPTPDGLLLDRRDAFWDPADLGGFPLVVKPNSQGSSVGVHVVEAPEALDAALDDAFRYAPVLVERFIPGREVTVAVLGGDALPVVEILAEEGFYDYAHKYTRGRTRYEVPARLPSGVAERLSHLGERAFAALGCAGVARVDFRLSPGGDPFCLEVNTIPGMTETSLVPMAAREAGLQYATLVDRLLQFALTDKK